MWHYRVPQIPWTDLMANNTLARALVALKSGFRTRFNTGLSKFPFSLPFTLPMTAPEHCSRVKGHTQDRARSVHSHAYSVWGLPWDCGRKIPGNPACWHGLNIQHHTERPRVGILTQNLFFRHEGEHFWITAKQLPPASSEDQPPRLVLIIPLPRQSAGEEMAPIDGRKTWNHAESCQIVSLAGHAKSGGWERGWALHFHHATRKNMLEYPATVSMETWAWELQRGTVKTHIYTRQMREFTFGLQSNWVFFFLMFVMDTQKSLAVCKFVAE